MAKRFTDSRKWDRENYRLLSLKGKVAWDYITSKCDNTGIWHPDFGLMSFQIGAKITREEFLAELGHKVVELHNGAWFIPSFIEFQYGWPLKPECNAHKPVIAALLKFGIELNGTGTVPQLLPKGSPTLMDKNKDQDKDQDKEKGGVGEKTNHLPKSHVRAEVERIYKAHYPRKEGKSNGVGIGARDCHTPEDLAALESAVIRFAEKKKGTDPKYLPYFSTFMAAWRDWLEPETGTAVGPPGTGETLLERMKQKFGDANDDAGTIHKTG